MEYKVEVITTSISYNVFRGVKTIRSKMGPHDVSKLLMSVMKETLL